jgi:hypothetical protein
LQPETAVYDPAEIDTLLERTCAALARYGSPRAWRALVDHGLKAETRLGSTVARLVEAGRQDFSSSKDLVKRIQDALKESLPKTVLGFTVKRTDDRTTQLIQALAGTPTPEVKAALKEVADKYPGEKFGVEAKKVLQAMAAPPAKAAEPAAAGLSGDLELFGLPGVLQTLSQTGLTGILTLLNKQGQPEATMAMDKGHFLGAQAGKLKDDDAVFQIFERPFPGTFNFVSKPATALPKGKPQDPMGLILEGVRRHDELKLAVAIVSDSATLKATGKAHTGMEDEKADFAEQLWGQVKPGLSALKIEGPVVADTFRTRRLLAHWVEEGALKIG